MCNKIQLIDEHKEVLDKAKSEYESLKRKMDEMRAIEVAHSFSFFFIDYLFSIF